MVRHMSGGTATYSPGPLLSTSMGTIILSFLPPWRWFSHQVVSDSCDPMNCSLPGSSVHGILQARILE